MWHPVIISLAVIDLLILILLLKTGVTAVDVVLNWKPESSHPSQLLLERKAETADIPAQWAFGIMAVNSLFLITAFTRILPSLIPGAMCGMGVMQALNDRAVSIIFLRSLALAVLYWQRVLARLNHTAPLSPLAVSLGRLSLLALLLFGMAAYDTAAGLFFDLNPSQPVSCCAVVLDQVASQTPRLSSGFFTAAIWPVAFGVLSADIIGYSASALLFRKTACGGICSSLLSLSVFIWAATAGISLVFFWSPYIYQVMDHHCPFCFFLPEHYSIGFALLGSLGWVSLESPVPFFLSAIRKSHPGLCSAIQIRYRRSMLIFFGGVSAFALPAVLPALMWRLRFGVWI